MNGNHSLLEAFYQTTYQLDGHSKRNIQILKEALNEMDGNLDSDMYGAGKLIEDFQNNIAKYFWRIKVERFSWKMC
jgi:hypothetical protein